MNIATLLPVSGHPLFTATHWCFYVITPFVDSSMGWLVKSLFFMLTSTRFMLKKTIKIDSQINIRMLVESKFW